MIPKFYAWIENIEAGGVSVSEPQHKEGENSLSIEKLVEKKIKELVDEVKRKRNVEENEILGSIKSYLEKISPSLQEPKSQENPNNQQIENPNVQSNQDLSQMPIS